MKPAKILFVFTGSIAAYKACEVVSRLVQAGHQVRCVATPTALRFIGPATLEGLTGTPVLSDLFENGRALDHINLSRWADAVIVCPATANTLNRFAAGLGDDLVGALFLAHDWNRPLLMVPAMNPAMWSHPATIAAVDKLRDWGVRFVAVGEGRTACGESGSGRMAEPAEIMAALEAALARPRRKLRVLVTSGGTAEPVDAVRVLTNTSTGGTGAGIADHLMRSGHEVVLVRARTAVPASTGCREEVFGGFAELDAALTRVLGHRTFDAVVHAAAVGDFGVAAVEVDGATRSPGAGKLPSDTPPVLRLQRQPKLLDTLRARHPHGPLTVVAFKLTTRATEAEARAAVDRLLQGGAADFVVHNDLAAQKTAGDFPATIHAADGRSPVSCPTRTALAAALEQILTSAPTPVGANT